MARKNAIERMVPATRRILIATSFVALLGALLKVGFQLHPEDIRLLEIFYPILLALIMACQVFLLWTERSRRKVGRVALAGWMLLLLSALGLLAFTFRPPGLVFEIMHSDFFPALFFLGMLTYELSMLQIGWWSAGIRPPTLFIGSFLFLILTGTLLLLLPRATREGITLIDALFTSTSAGCVTGLVVLDTGRDFTVFGQWVILSLIQLGGLGMMTFTSFFAFFFRGDSSFGNRLMLHNLTQTTNLNNVFGVLSRILLVTFCVEAIGALLIFREVPMAGPWGERVRFSLFHAVSAFCNAGFSTLGDSLYARGFRDNYALHMIIAVLLIVGGLGFPIVFNLLRYFRFHAALIWARLRNRTHKAQKPNLMTLNSRIVLATTALLLLVGTLLIYIAD